MTVRGIRNNNPLNLEYGPFTRQFGATGSDGRFAIFPTMAMGIRAAAENLIGYEENHGIDTIQGTIERWAPGNENNVAAYVAFVCHVCEVRPNDRLDFHNRDVLYWLITAMGEEECGTDEFTHGVTDSDLEAGIANALASGNGR
jgi:hypothetical protein